MTFAKVPGFTCSLWWKSRESMLSASLALLVGGGCRGEDLEHDCDRQFQAFSGVVENEERALLAAPPESGGYPMALRVSEVGLNRLLASVIDEGVPFAGTVPFGFLPSGPGEASFEAQSVPVLEITEVPGCERCVVFGLDFGVRVASATTQEPLSSGPGFAKLAIPLRLDTDLASGTSTLIADYGEAKIIDWSLSVYGFDSEVHTTLAGALQILLEEEIRADFGEVELMRLGSWSFGAEGVVISASALEMRPDTKELVLGMRTNLPLPQSVGVDLEEPLPTNAPLGIAFDTQLLLAMTHHMLAEGAIARRYDDAGAPDESGPYGVTVNRIATRETPGRTLDTQFRIWRLDDGYCGFATAQMPLQLRPRNQGAGANVVPGAAMLVADGPAEGVGAAALEEEQLVEDNRGLVNVFREALSEQVANTLNYEELQIAGGHIYFATEEIVAAGDTVSILLDFLVVALPSED